MYLGIIIVVEANVRPRARSPSMRPAQNVRVWSVQYSTSTLVQVYKYERCDKTCTSKLLNGFDHRN
jgi:hypothetical protein